MFQDREKREKLKKYLVVSIAALAVILLTLLLYGFLSVRPKQLAKASDLGQYIEFSSHDLPKSFNKYFEHKQNLSSKDDGSEINLQDNIPKIAILVTNLGLNRNSTELALSLPKEVSLGFLPYTTTLKGLYNNALEDGREMYLYIPFQTARFPDDFPGYLPILETSSDEENIARLNTLLNSLEGYKGIYASYKEVFTKNSTRFLPLIDELNQRNLSLFLGRSGGDIKFVGEKNIDAFSADIVLDSQPNVSSIKDNLDKLVSIAKDKGYAIAYADSFPVTIYTLKAWIPMLKQSNVQLVPISHITKDRKENGEESQ